MRVKLGLPRFSASAASSGSASAWSSSSSSSTSLPTPPPSLRRSLLTPPPTVPPLAPFTSAIASTFEGVQEPGLRMVLFGKPGSGKGTLSQRVLETYPDVNLVSVGDVLRKEIAAKSEVGLHAESLVARGEFVPDEVMIQITINALAPLHSTHWILDGFPRTLNQGRLLDAVLAKEGRAPNLIVSLGVQDETILRRIEDRWIHILSGRVYNATYNRPLVPGFDDLTGEPLSKRPDDTPEVFSKRLEMYHRETHPLLNYYETHYPAETHELKGETSNEIWPELKDLLEGVFTSGAGRGMGGWGGR